MLNEKLLLDSYPMATPFVEHSSVSEWRNELGIHRCPGCVRVAGVGQAGCFIIEGSAVAASRLWREGDNEKS